MASRFYTATMCLLLALFSLACGASAAQGPTAPTGFSLAVVPGAVPQNLPIVLSGQSNANYMGPGLTAAYAPGVTVTARNSTPLSWWDDTGSMWPDLVTAVSHGPLTALVWWQGEQDALDGVSTEAYNAHLTAFLARVRAAADQPHLLIVIVEIRLFQPVGSPAPYGSAIRLAQERVATTTPDTILVNMDDLPSPAGDVSGNVHLVYPEGYQIAAQRIVSAIRTR